MSHNVSKTILCPQYFRVVSRKELHSSWQAQGFGDLHRHFAWQARHFRRVVLRFWRIALSGLHGNVQILAGEAFSDM